MTTDFVCPRCNTGNTGEAPYLHTNGYARCTQCNIGIEWESTIFSTDVIPIDTYVPQGSVISPKSSKVLDGEKVYLSTPKVHKFFNIISFSSGYERRKRFEGTLK